MKGGRSIWERMDLPGETFPGQVLAEIAGENRILIEGHRGVREYSQNCMGVNVNFGMILVRGACLELGCMTKEQLVICGRIDSVELKRRSDK